MSILRRTIAATAIATMAVIGFTACSQGNSTPDARRPATSAPKASPAETVYNECIDGAVQLYPGDDADPKTPVTAGDCAAANVIGSDLTYTLGTVKTVTVEAQHTTVTVDSPEKVVFTGNENTVLYTGDHRAPGRRPGHGQRTQAGRLTDTPLCERGTSTVPRSLHCSNIYDILNTSVSCGSPLTPPS